MKDHSESLRGEDYLDSRDLIARADYLRSLKEAHDADPDPSDREDLTDDEAEELAAIDKLAESGIEDWQHGAQFIREDKFEDYARDFAEDIGAIQKDAPWPCGHIDWTAAADELRQGYTSVDFLGEAYLVR